MRDELTIKFGSQYGPEEEAAVLRVLRENAPTSGNACVAFEKAFAEYCGVEYARCVSNGTAALFLSLVGLDIKPGDRVITTPITWIATAAAPVTLGAEIDFVDVDPVTYNINPAEIEAAITPATKAIVPVHLYGQCADMDPILAIAEKHGVPVIEDACHAIGARYRGRAAGSMGTTGCFSFHEQKNISTLGEGGMVVTNDPAIFERVALYRSHCTRVHGGNTKYCALDPAKFPMDKKFWWQDFDDCGYNFRMTDIQAAVGLEQLKKLDCLNQRRIDNAAYLSEALGDIPGLSLPVSRPDCTHVFHLYPVCIDPELFGLTKEDFIYRMRHEHDIQIGFHYIPLHWSTAFQNRGYRRGQFPVAERLAERLVTFPINPRQTRDHLDCLIDAVRSLRT
ncbi:MAG: DegT/DnrJ/EryC1/StrS family aminotransferase [Candidatus Hydrogenedentes bacterium]|nr:DegT/DnrJ/EryC1/StrS family aminotransferase [Candidatus Hydrogenedentota bacterium]